MGGDPAELMRICVENGMFTVSFFKEGIQKVSCHGFLYLLYMGVDISSVPRLDRRLAENIMGSMSGYRCANRKPQCYGWLPYRRGVEDTVFPSVYYDLVTNKVSAIGF